MNRRRFLGAAFLPTLLRATVYDLVIRNGRVIDPSQRIDRVMDVAIHDGKIAALGRNLEAAESIDATGKLVLPGLIDIHLHARDAELPPSAILSTGVTTMVDAGSRGADNVDQLIATARDAPNRMRILLNIGLLGNNPGGRGEFLDGIEPADGEKAGAVVVRDRAWIIGMKARLSRGISGDRDLEVLRRALEAAAPLKIPVMIHIGDTASPLPRILALLRAGDIVTHLYAPGAHGIFDERGRILPEVRAARHRGVLFDFGNGRNGHWTWETAQSALRKDFRPIRSRVTWILRGIRNKSSIFPRSSPSFWPWACRSLKSLPAPLQTPPARSTSSDPTGRFGPARLRTSLFSNSLKEASNSWTTTKPNESDTRSSSQALYSLRGNVGRKVQGSQPAAEGRIGSEMRLRS
jgi:dihydroorotase